MENGEQSSEIQSPVFVNPYFSRVDSQDEDLKGLTSTFERRKEDKNKRNPPQPFHFDKGISKESMGQQERRGVQIGARNLKPPPSNPPSLLNDDKPQIQEEENHHLLDVKKQQEITDDHQNNGNKSYEAANNNNSEADIKNKPSTLSANKKLAETARLFDYFVIVGIGDMPSAEESETGEEQIDPLSSIFRPSIISRYPTQNHDVALPPHIWMFCFPKGITLMAAERLRDVKELEVFFFTLTELDGGRFYGTSIVYYEKLSKECKDYIYSKFPNATIPQHDIYAPKCICIISHYRFYRLFNDCLIEIHRTLRENENSPFPIEYYLRTIHEVLVPPRNVKMNFKFGVSEMQVISSVNSDISALDDFNFLPLFMYMGVENVIQLFACVLLEQKLCIHSTNCSNLTFACEIITSLLHPFKWQHVYIPILPRWLLEFLNAPTPFIMGIHSSFRSESPEDNHIIYVDLDNNAMRLPEAISLTISSYKVITHLQYSLKQILKSLNRKKLHRLCFEFHSNSITEKERSLQLEIVCAFQTFFAKIFSNYSKHFLYLRMYPEPIKVFNKTSFLREVSSEDDAMFAAKFMNTPSFSVFLSEADRRPRSNFDQLITYLTQEDQLVVQKLISKSHPIGQSSSHAAHLTQTQSFHHRSPHLFHSSSSEDIDQKISIIRGAQNAYIEVTVPQSPYQGDYIGLGYSYKKMPLSSLDENLVYPDPRISLLYNYSEIIASAQHLRIGNDKDDGGIFSASYASDAYLLRSQQLEAIKAYLHEFKVKNEGEKERESFISEEITLNLFQSTQQKFQSRLLISKNFKVIQFMAKIIDLIFNSQPISGNDLSMLMDFFKTDSGRILFADLIFQHYENLKSISKTCGMLSKNSYDLLTNLILVMLTEANASFDFVSASMLLNLCLIFYYDEPTLGGIHWLHEAVRQHKLWSNNQFWEFAFYNAIQTQRIIFYNHLNSNELLKSVNMHYNNNNNPPPHDSKKKLKLSPTMNNYNNSNNNSSNNKDDQQHDVINVSPPPLDNNQISDLQQKNTSVDDTSSSNNNNHNSSNDDDDDEENNNNDNSKSKSNNNQKDRAKLSSKNNQLTNLTKMSSSYFNKMITAKLDWKNMTKEQQEICVVGEEELLFKVLSYFVNNMLLFGKSSNLVRRFVHQLSEIVNLQYEKIKMLNTLIDNLNQFLQVSLDVKNDEDDVLNCAAISKYDTSKKGSMKEMFNNLVDDQQRIHVSTKKHYFRDFISYLSHDSADDHHHHHHPSSSSSSPSSSSSSSSKPESIPLNVKYDSSHSEYSLVSLSLNKSNDGFECMEVGGTIAVCGCRNGTLVTFDLRNKSCNWVVPAHLHRITAVNYAGDKVASGSVDQALKIWDIQTGSCTNVFTEHTGTISKIQLFSSDVFISSSYDNSIRVWDVRSRRCSLLLNEHHGPVNHFKLNFSSNNLFSASRDTTIKRWDIRQTKSMQTYKGHSDAVTLVDCDNSIIPDSLISSSYDCSLKLWNINTSQCEQTFTGHNGFINSFDFSANILVSASSDAATKVWNINTGRCYSTILGHTDEVTKVIILNDYLIASASHDGTIRISTQSSSSKKLTPKVTVLRGHTDAITCLCEIENRLISCSLDGTLRVWEYLKPKKGKFKQMLKVI